MATEAASAGGMELSERDHRTLGLVFETLLGQQPAAEADRRPTHTDTAGLPIVHYAADLFGRTEPEDQRDLRRLLGLMQNAAVNALIGRRPKSFDAMTVPEREEYLRRLATSPIPQMRKGFQALKRTAFFLFYSMPGPDGSNPAWPEIGYPGPPSAPAAPARSVRLAPVRETAVLEADVCVIGSGAGGGVVAAELAAAGKRVIVLEAGSGLQAADFDQHELSGIRDLYLDHGLTASHDLGVSIIAGSTLGGGTTVNWQTSWRVQDRVREEWAQTSGLGFFTDPAFDRSLDAVTARLHVSTAESDINANNAVISDGSQALGRRFGTIARNALGCDLKQCGFCTFGCRQGGKQSTAVTYLVDAQAQGRDTRVVANCRVDRLVIGNGRVAVAMATATDPDSHTTCTVQVRAQTFVVACGALHSPALLLRSGLDHPAIGTRLFLHPAVWLVGTYPRAISAWDGPPQTTYSDEFATLDGNHGFVFEAVPAHPGGLALGMPWFGSLDHRQHMRDTARMAVFIALARDRQGGRVRISRSGRPLIEYTPGRQEVRHLQRGTAEGVRLHLAAGADTVMTLHTHRPGVFTRETSTTQADIDAFCAEIERWPITGNRCLVWSAHQMGTCNMGADAKRSVCDEEGHVRGVSNLYVADGSLFPSASGVNPMITIMALAHHVAQGIAS